MLGFAHFTGCAAVERREDVFGFEDLGAGVGTLGDAAGELEGVCGGIGAGGVG